MMFIPSPLRIRTFGATVVAVSALLAASVVMAAGLLLMSVLYLRETTLFVDREDDDRNVIFARKGNCRDVHDGQALLQDLVMRQAVEARRGRVLLRIGGVNTVNTVLGYQNLFSADLQGALSGNGVG